MRKIILGYLPSDYNKKKDIVLSDLSFNDTKSAFSTETYLFTADNFEEKMKLSGEIENLSIHYSDLFAEKFNPKIYHRFSKDFWRRLYFDNTYQIISLIDRYDKSLKKIFNIFPRSRFEVELFKSPSFEELIKENDINRKFDIFLQHKILSKIVLQFPKKFQFIFLEQNFTNGKFDDNETLKESFIKRVDNFFDRSSRGYGIGFFYNIILSIFLSLIKNHQHKDHRASKPVKKKISNFFIYENLIEDLICKDLKNLSNKIEKLKTKKFKPFSKRLLLNNLYRNTPKKIIAGLAREKKEKIISIQHGGYNYGFWKGYKGTLNFTEYRYDYFISWGSKSVNSKTNKNFISLPSPFLSKFFNKHKLKNNKIILVGTIAEKVFTKYEYDRNKAMTKKYFSNKKDLISEFDKKFTLCDFYYKPYPHFTPHAYNDKEYFGSIFPELKILNSNLHLELLKCKLLILDHPGTTLNIAMVSNTPTLLFWTSYDFDFTDKMNLFIEDFKKEKIFHSNKDSLIKHLGKFNSDSDLMKWWNSDLIQGLRIRWCNEYAKTDKFWILKWLKALYHL